MNVVMTPDVDDRWDLVQNDIDELDATEGPESWPIGYTGESIFSLLAVNLDGADVRVLIQVRWTAVDPRLESGRNADPDDFDPTVDILDTTLLEPTETVYLIDNPTEQPDESYTVQGEFRQEQTDWAAEAISDNLDQLFAPDW